MLVFGGVQVVSKSKRYAINSMDADQGPYYKENRCDRVRLKNL